MAGDTTDNSEDPWRVEVSSFPYGAPLADQLRHALRWAVLAPSIHNTQPWLYRVGDDHVDVVLDRSRGLPVVDPDDRALTMSVAATVAVLELVLVRFGLSPWVDWWPRHDDRDLVARLTVMGEAVPSGEDLALFDAITQRRTNRGPFLPGPVPPGVLERAAADAAAEGAWLEFVEGAARDRLAALIVEGDARQMADAAFRRELDAWTDPGPDGARRLDGVRVYDGPLRRSSGSPLLQVRTFDTGGGPPTDERALALGSPVLGVLGTDGDTVADWAACGSALVRVLLGLTASGLGVCFMNQPIEVPELRPEVARSLGREGLPQLLVRIGVPAVDVPHTPRRPLADVLLTR